MMAKQQHACAICRDPIGWDAPIDHDHACCPTGAPVWDCGRCVRGILCVRCNVSLRHHDDDYAVLRQALLVGVQRLDG